MRIIYKIKTKIFNINRSLGLYKNIDDETYIKKIYKVMLNRKINLDEPKRYTEKLNWLKLNDHNSKYPKYVDKYEAKKIVADTIGHEHIIPTIGVYDSFEEIDFDELPEKFVIKCTHDSGGVIVCSDKNNFDIAAAKKKINKHMNKNFYYDSREWPYKSVKPRILVEEYMEDESGELQDYKFFVFEGKAKSLFIATNRNKKEETCFDFYDMEFNHLPFTNGHPNSAKKIEKPKNFDKMIEIAEKLGKDFLHVRIDLYNVNGKIYFGEYTLYHWGGIQVYDPDVWDYKFGEWLNLNNLEKYSK